MVNIIVILVLLIFLILSGYIIFIQQLKIKKFEEFAKDSENFKILLLKRLHEVLHRIVAVDKIGAFESDDDVGFIYQYIRTEIINLHKSLGLKEDAAKKE